MSSALAVIGLGNTLRRDDGIGVSVLESLCSLYKREGVDYLNFGTASFDLLHKIGSYDTVLLIDGIDASLKAGELRIFRLDEIASDMSPRAKSSHELGLKEIFELYKRLGLSTKVHVAGIQVEDISYKDGLTETLQLACGVIVKEIDAFIGRTLNSCDGT